MWPKADQERAFHRIYDVPMTFQLEQMRVFQSEKDIGSTQLGFWSCGTLENEGKLNNHRQNYLVAGSPQDLLLS